MFSKKTPPAQPPAEPVVEQEKRRFTDNLGGNVSVLGNDLIIKGELKGKANVELNGKIEGSVDLDAALIILTSGSVIGDVTAQNVMVQGSIKGDVVAKQKIELRDGCQVIGNLQAGSIAISEGAFFQGTVKMLGSTKSTDPVSFSEKRVDV